MSRICVRLPPIRVSIKSGEELAKSDVGERESRREKKVGDALDAAKSGRNALWLLLFHSGSSTSQLSIKNCQGPSLLLGSSGDLELPAAGERAYPLALLLVFSSVQLCSAHSVKGG